MQSWVGGRGAAVPLVVSSQSNSRLRDAVSHAEGHVLTPTTSDYQIPQKFISPVAWNSAPRAAGARNPRLLGTGHLLRRAVSHSWLAVLSERDQHEALNNDVSFVLKMALSVRVTPLVLTPARGWARRA